MLGHVLAPNFIQPKMFICCIRQYFPSPKLPSIYGILKTILDLHILVNTANFSAIYLHPTILYRYVKAHPY